MFIDAHAARARRVSGDLFIRRLTPLLLWLARCLLFAARVRRYVVTHVARLRGYRANDTTAAVDNVDRRYDIITDSRQQDSARYDGCDYVTLPSMRSRR